MTLVELLDNITRFLIYYFISNICYIYIAQIENYKFSIARIVNFNLQTIYFSFFKMNIVCPFGYTAFVVSRKVEIA